MMGFSFVQATEASVDALSSVLGEFESLFEKYKDSHDYTGAHDAFIFRDDVRSHQKEVKVVPL